MSGPADQGAAARALAEQTRQTMARVQEAARATDAAQRQREQQGGRS